MRYLIAVLALAGLIDSYLALRIHNQDPASIPPCSVDARFDCGAVNHGPYSVFPPDRDFTPNPRAIHIPVAIFGILGYGLIALFALWNKLWITLQLTEIGFFFAAFLTYLEAWVIDKWCIYCLVSMGIISAILLCTIVALVLKHRSSRVAHPTAS